MTKERNVLCCAKLITEPFMTDNLILSNTFSQVFNVGTKRGITLGFHHNPKDILKSPHE